MKDFKGMILSAAVISIFPMIFGTNVASAKQRQDVSTDTTQKQVLRKEYQLYQENKKFGLETLSKYYDGYDLKHSDPKLIVLNQKIPLYTGKNTEYLKPSAKGLDVISMKSYSKGLAYRITVNYQGNKIPLNVSGSTVVPLHYTHKEIYSKLGKTTDFTVKIAKDKVKIYYDSQLKKTIGEAKRDNVLRIRSVYYENGKMNFELDDGHYISGNRMNTTLLR